MAESITPTHQLPILMMPSTGSGTVSSAMMGTAEISSATIANGADLLMPTPENVGLEDLSNLPEYKLNSVYWKRVARVLSLGLSTPFSEPLLWAVVALNVAAQVAGGYVAQMIFYFSATGSGTADPGISGCLGRGCGYTWVMTNATRTPHEVYARPGGSWQWTTIALPVNPTLELQVVPPPGATPVLLAYMSTFAWSFFVLVACVLAFSVAGDVLNVMLRRRLGRILHRALLKGNTLYRLTLDGRVDNFDQRITSDLQALLDGLCCCIFGNTSDYTAYPVVFCLSRMSLAWINTLSPLPDPSKAPAIVVVALTMAGIALLAYVIPMNQISRIFFIGQMYEGDFRYTHTRTVVHSESIAFYRGEAREKAHAERRFKKILYNARRYYVYQGCLMILRLIVINCQPSVCYMALSIGGAPDEVYANAFVKQMGDVLEYLLYLPVIISRMAFVSGVAHRVGQLMEVMQELQDAEEVKAVTSQDAEFIELTDIVARPPVFQAVEKHHEPWYAKVLRCWDFTTEAPTDKPPVPEPLFKNLSLRVDRGHGVVIMGRSGCGKSSLLRVIGGLWPITSGTVCRPDRVGRGGFFFLPQRPYVFPGTLSGQVTYPNPADRMDKYDILPILREVGLAHLEDRLHSNDVLDWGRVLSTSEQQRLSFARLFFHKPRFCLMDEATSCMDMHMENKCLRKCAEMGITLISVAHRPSVIPHHEFVFQFNSEQRVWDLVPASQVETSTGLHGDEEAVEAPMERSEDKTTQHAPNGLGMKAFQRIYKACCLPGRGITKWPAFCFLTMWVMMGLYGGLQIMIFKWFGTSKIIKEVVNGDTGRAMGDALAQIAMNVLGSVTMSLAALAGALYGLMVHRAIIKDFHRTYFHRRVPFVLNKVDKKIPDVDQRVVQDLTSMRESLAWLFGNPFAYQMQRNGLLTQITPLLLMLGYAFSMDVGTTVFFVLVLLAAFVVQFLACRVTSKATEVRNMAEGDLRMHYGRLRNFCESITFFGGQPRELEAAEKLLDTAMDRRLDYVVKAATTCAPTIMIYYWLQNGVYMMCAIVQLYLTRGSSVSAEVYTLLAYLVIVGKLTSTMVMSVGGLGMLAGNTHRVMEALEKAWEIHALVEAEASRKGDGGGASSRENRIAMREVTVTTPGGKRSLVTDLSFTVEAEQPMIIMGPSGCGKTSIFRVLGGLVEPARGTYIIPRSETVFFVPQTNYSTEGTLKDQIIYPMDHSAAPDDGILSILDEVGLLYLAKRWGLNSPVNWDDVLSGGEMQRLGVARMLFSNPMFAVVDEFTSALDVPLEARMLEACQRRGITLLAVATRPTVVRFFDRLLRLDGRGGYTITAVGKGTAEGPSSSVAAH